MNTVLSLIFMLGQNTLRHDLMYNIAYYIIGHMDEMKDKSIKQLAEDCYTSTTSIIKFCKLVGFNSYSEFKRQLLSNFETRRLQLNEKHKYLTIDALIDKIELFSMENIDRNDLILRVDQIVDAILKQKIMYFYGAAFPLALIQSFCEDMAVMGIPVHGVQISRGKNEIEKKDGVHIIMSLSGRYMRTRYNEYESLCNMNDFTVLISKEREYLGDVSINIPLPETISTDYDDLVLLLILDIIKLKCYESLKI